MTEISYFLMNITSFQLLLGSQGFVIFYPNLIQTFLNLKLKPLKIFFWSLFLLWEFFLILNPYNFVPLTAHIKLEINYSNELEHKCSQEVSLMALNDTFTIQEMDLDTKNLSYDIKAKELEAFWYSECEKHHSNNHFKIFCN